VYTLKEGEKRTIRAKVKRREGSGAIVLTTPERRIVDANRALVAGFDWAAASWDPNTNELSALFDSTSANLSAVGTYYMELRGTVGPERYGIEIQVDVQEWGP
jgi:hypothetical protein